MKFTERFANAAVCPVAREIPEKIKKELDEYLARKKKRAVGEASYELHNHIHKKPFQSGSSGGGEKIDIQDIAHALSLTCRNGHVSSFWSVGEHCICCAKEALGRGYSIVALACLFA